MAVNSNADSDLQRAAAVEIPNIVPTADAARTAALGIAGTIVSAQQSSLAIHRARTAFKFGAQSDAVGRLDERITALTTLAAAIEQLGVSAVVQPPDVPAGSAALFGQVLDPQGSGIKGAAVQAVGASGKALRKASSAADGSYQVVIPIPAAIRAGTTATAPSGLVVHLQVQIGGRTVLDDAEQITLNPGMAVMRTLIVTPPKPAKDPARKAG